MALFPSDNVRPEEEATRRRAVTQETGTRTLVIGFIALVALWFVGSKIWDAYLLRQNWPAVSPDGSGLTVVGTLDGKGSYDRNLFRILQIEGDARPELTDFGWKSIFSGEHGPLTTDAVGNTILAAINLDGETGYAMLEPLLAAEVRFEMGDHRAYSSLTGDSAIETSLPITTEEKIRKHIRRRKISFQQLLVHFKDEQRDAQVKDAGSEGGSGSGRQVEHGLAIPGDILSRTCPVVLSGKHFSGGSVEEHPAVVMGSKTYSVWLQLTPEGRSRFFQWSRGHVNEHLVLVLNGEVVANGRVAMTMDVSQWEITNLKDGDSAHKLVQFITSHQNSAK